MKRLIALNSSINTSSHIAHKLKAELTSNPIIIVFSGSYLNGTLVSDKVLITETKKRIKIMFSPQVYFFTIIMIIIRQNLLEAKVVKKVKLDIDMITKLFLLYHTLLTNEM